MDWDADWIEIFRVGDYAAKGRFTTVDLDAMVANFQHWKPPLVLGHPDTDSPAMGWAAELKREGDRLLMRVENVQPELRAHVASGRFPNRSIALYTNPKGTGPTVRHIGFLGAMPPEVKGLAPIRFRDIDFVEINLKVKEERMEFPKVRFSEGSADDTNTWRRGTVTYSNGEVVRFAARPGMDLDLQGFDVVERTYQFMEKNPKLDFGEALKKARRVVMAETA